MVFDKEAKSSTLPIEVAAGMGEPLWVEAISQFEYGQVFADDPTTAQKVRLAYRELTDPDLFKVVPRAGDNYYFGFSVKVGEKTYYLKFSLAQQMESETTNQLRRIRSQLNEALGELSKASKTSDRNPLIFVGEFLSITRDHQARIKPATKILLEILNQVLNPPVEKINPSLRTIISDNRRIRICPTRLSSSGIYWWEEVVLEDDSTIRSKYYLAVLKSQSQRKLFLGS